MESQFAQLCDLLDDEAERQETLLTVLESQRRAIQARDVEHLEAKSLAMRSLIKEAADAQATRHAVLQQIVDGLSLSIEEQTLTNLIQRAPEPFARRLRESQARLQQAMASSKKVVRDNSVSLRRSLRVVHKCLDAVQGCSQEHPAYDRAGQERRLDGPAALLNQQG